MKTLFAGLAVGTVALATLAFAQSYPPPQVQSIGPTDLFQDIPNGAPSAGNVYAPATLLGNYSASLAGNNPENVLVGGDFGTNLFQDGASVGSVSTSITYVADQWAAWGGSTTVITGTQQTGASDITAAYSASLRINKASGTAGSIPACVLQEVSTADSLRFQGQTAEFDFNAKAGAGFSSATSALAVSIVWGTGTDEGISKLAFAFNAGGGGSSTWTGQTNAASNLAVPITTGWTRYTVAAAIPATATELAVIICYTPVGNGGATDWFEFTGAQLARNSALTSVVGTAGAVLTADTRAKAFARRSQTDEAVAELSYYWRQDEAASTKTVYGICQGLASTTHANCTMNFPVKMHAVPTLAFTAGTIQATANTAGAAAAVTGLAIISTGASQYAAALDATVTSAATITGILGAGNSTGGGKIAFSARF